MIVHCSPPVPGVPPSPVPVRVSAYCDFTNRRTKRKRRDGEECGFAKSWRRLELAHVGAAGARGSQPSHAASAFSRACKKSSGRRGLPARRGPRRWPDWPRWEGTRGRNDALLGGTAMAFGGTAMANAYLLPRRRAREPSRSARGAGAEAVRVARGRRRERDVDRCWRRRWRRITTIRSNRYFHFTVPYEYRTVQPCT